MAYRDAIDARLTSLALPGHFDVYFDDSHDHWLSPNTNQVISDDDAKP